jgi:hypothetical protein
MRANVEELRSKDDSVELQLAEDRVEVNALPSNVLRVSQKRLLF